MDKTGWRGVGGELAVLGKVKDKYELNLGVENV